jgi:hypothetical protein
MQFRDLPIGAAFFLPGDAEPCFKRSDETARDNSCAPDFCFSVRPEQTVEHAVPHPAVHAAWIDARHSAAALARTQGYAVLVDEGAGYRVLVGPDVESCMRQAGQRKILADFDHEGRQS